MLPIVGGQLVKWTTRRKPELVIMRWYLSYKYGMNGESFGGTQWRVCSLNDCWITEVTFHHKLVGKQFKIGALL